MHTIGLHTIGMYSVQTRQRLPEAAHYGEWRPVPGSFHNGHAAKQWATHEVAERSHSLDVRVIGPRGEVRATIRAEARLLPLSAPAQAACT